MLHIQTRASLPAARGHIERRDYEYVRQGTADLFVMVEPLAGWRHSTNESRRDQCEGRRRHVWEHKQQGWKQSASAAALGVPPGACRQPGA